MIKILSVNGRRSFDNLQATPELHWVELVFQNDHGIHTVELNGTRPLPAEPALRDDLEWLLWDYGLLCQQDSRTSRQRVRVAQQQIEIDVRNYLFARAYMEEIGQQ